MYLHIVISVLYIHIGDSENYYLIILFKLYVKSCSYQIWDWLIQGYETEQSNPIDLFYRGLLSFDDNVEWKSTCKKLYNAQVNKIKIIS